MFALDPLPYPALNSELRIIKAPQDVVLKEVRVLEGTTSTEETTRTVRIKGTNKTATVTSASGIVTNSVAFSRHINPATGASRVSLSAIQQHVTVTFPPTFDADQRLRAAPSVVMPPSFGEAPAALEEEGLAALTGKPTAKSTEVCASLPEPSRSLIEARQKESGAKASDENKKDGKQSTTAHSYAPLLGAAGTNSQWAPTPTPSAMALVAASTLDDAAWGVTLQGLAYARVPVTDTASGQTIEENDDNVDEKEEGEGNAEKNADGSDKKKASSPQMLLNLKGATAATALSAKEKSKAIKRMDESTSDEDDSDAVLADSTTIGKTSARLLSPGRGGGAAQMPSAVDEASFHASWTFAPSSDVDHEAYKLRGRAAPKNIVPHQLFRHIAVGSRTCVWAITNDGDDAGRLVRREGFDPRDCVRSRGNNKPTAYQHRVGDKWVDYSDDIVPTPKSILAQGGWFPAPVAEGSDGKAGGGRAGVGQQRHSSSSTAMVEDDQPYATTWVTHPANCPFLASDARQYGNQLIDVLARTTARDKIIGADTTTTAAMQKTAVIATAGGDGTAGAGDVSAIIPPNNTSVTISQDANMNNTLPIVVVDRLGQNPFIKTMQSLKARQFVACSVGKDGSLWAVTEEEVVTKLVVDDVTVSHPDEGVRRVWSRLWYREGSSLDSAGSRWIEATEFFDELDTLLDPQDPFAVSAIASSRYQRDQNTATVPKFRILSLTHSVQHELFAVIAVAGDDDDNDEQSILSETEWTRDIRTAYHPRRSGYLFQRVGITESNPTGTHWRRVVLESSSGDNNLSNALTAVGDNDDDHKNGLKSSLPPWLPPRLIKIRSFALCPLIDDRHWAANGISKRYEESRDELYSRYNSFCATIGSAVVVTADGRDIVDVTRAVKKHMATQQQSASFRIFIRKEKKAHGGKKALLSTTENNEEKKEEPTKDAAAMSEEADKKKEDHDDAQVKVIEEEPYLIIGDLLPLPLVLHERARLIKPLMHTPTTLAPSLHQSGQQKNTAITNVQHDGALVTVGNQEEEKEEKGQLVVAGGGDDDDHAASLNDISIVNHEDDANEAVVIAAAESNPLGVGLNRFDNAMRILHPNVSDVFVDSVLLSVEKQRAINPLSVRALDAYTTTVSYGIEDEQKAAFSTLSARGVRVPADLVEGLRQKLQLLRHRSSVPVSDYLHGSLLTAAVTRDTKGAVTDIVATVNIDINEEPETSDDDEDEEEEGAEGERSAFTAGGGEAHFSSSVQRRRSRPQYAHLTVWMPQVPLGPTPTLSKHRAAYAKLSITRYQIPSCIPTPAAPLPPSPTPAVDAPFQHLGAGGIGCGDVIGNFVMNVTGCDINGAAQMDRFQRATINNTTFWRSSNTMLSSSGYDDETFGAKIIETVVPTESKRIGFGAAVMNTTAEASATTTDKAAKRQQQLLQRSRRGRHVRANIAIEFFCGQCKVPVTERDEKEAAASSPDAALLIPPPRHRSSTSSSSSVSSADDRDYASRQCRTIISLHPSTVRVMGLKPREVKAASSKEGKKNASIEDTQLTTITVTHTYARPLSHHMGSSEGEVNKEGSIAINSSMTSYGDPKIVIAMPIAPQQALRDLSALFALENNTNNNGTSCLSDAQSSKYLQKLEGLRSLLSPLGSEATKATLFLSNGTNAIVAPIYSSTSAAVNTNVSKGLQLSSGAHVGFLVASRALPPGLFDATVTIGSANNAQQEDVYAVCPLTLEAVIPNCSSSGKINRGLGAITAALPSPPQQHRSAPRDGSPFLITAVGSRTMTFAASFYGHCCLEPLRANLPQQRPNEDSLWYALDAEGDASVRQQRGKDNSNNAAAATLSSAAPSFVQIRDASVFIFQSPPQQLQQANGGVVSVGGGGKSASGEPYSSLCVTALIAATVEVCVSRGSAADASLHSVARGAFTVSDAVAADGVRLTFAGDSTPSTVTTLAKASQLPVATFRHLTATSSWVMQRVAKTTPFILTRLQLSPSVSGIDTHGASFLGIPCASRAGGAGKDVTNNNSDVPSAAMLGRASVPAMLYTCASSDGALQPLGAKALLRSRRTTVPLLGPSDPSDTANVSHLNLADIVAYPCEWNRIANAGHSRELIVLDGDDRLAASHTVAADRPVALSEFGKRERLTTMEEKALKAKLTREMEMRAAAMSVLQSIRPRAAEVGTAAWLHDAAATDELCQVAHDKASVRTLTRYLRERPVKWMVDKKKLSISDATDTTSPPLTYNTHMALQAVGPQTPMAGRKFLIATVRPKRPAVEATDVAAVDTVMLNSTLAPLPIRCDLLPMRWRSGDARIPSLSAEDGSAVWELHRCLDRETLRSIYGEEESQLPPEYNDNLVRDGDLVKVVSSKPIRPAYADGSTAQQEGRNAHHKKENRGEDDEAMVAHLVPPMVKTEVTVWQIRAARKEETEEEKKLRQGIPLNETPVQRAIRERAEIRAKIQFASTGSARINPSDVSAIVAKRRGEVIKLTDSFELLHPVRIDARAVAGTVVEQQPDRLLTFAMSNLDAQQAKSVDADSGALELPLSKSTDLSSGGTAALSHPSSAALDTVSTNFSQWQAVPVVLVPSQHTHPAEATDVKLCVRTVAERADEVQGVIASRRESYVTTTADSSNHLVNTTSSGRALPSSSSSSFAAAPLSVFGLDAFAKVEITMSTVNMNVSPDEHFSPNSSGLFSESALYGSNTSSATSAKTSYPRQRVTVTISGNFVNALPLGKLGVLANSSEEEKEGRGGLKSSGPKFKITVENICTLSDTSVLDIDTSPLQAEEDVEEVKAAMLSRSATLPQMHRDCTAWHSTFSFDESTTVIQWATDSSEKLTEAAEGVGLSAAAAGSSSAQHAEANVSRVESSRLISSLTAAEATRFNATSRCAFATDFNIAVNTTVPLAHRAALWPCPISLPLAITVRLPSSVADNVTTTAHTHNLLTSATTAAAYTHVWAGSGVRLESSMDGLLGPRSAAPFPWSVLIDVIRASRPPTASAAKPSAALTEAEAFRASEVAKAQQRLQQELKHCDKLVRQLFEQKAKMPNASRAQQAVVQSQIDDLTQNVIPKLLVQLSSYENAASPSDGNGNNKTLANSGASGTLQLIKGGGGGVKEKASSVLRVAKVVDLLHQSGLVDASLFIPPPATTTDDAVGTEAASAAADNAQEAEGYFTLQLSAETTNSSSVQATHALTVSARRVGSKGTSDEGSDNASVTLVKGHPAQLFETFSI